MDEIFNLDFLKLGADSGNCALSMPPKLCFHQRNRFKWYGSRSLLILSTSFTDAPLLTKMA